jgi:hypothetical protein
MTFYIWLLPLLCGTCSYLHRSYPGDEHGLWLLGSGPGLWIAPFVFGWENSKESTPIFIAAALAVVMLPVGWMMDRFEIRKTHWGTLFLVCATGVLVTSVLSYSSIERAISKNGSWWSYILLSINLGVYLSFVPSIVMTVLLRKWKTTRNAL